MLRESDGLGMAPRIGEPESALLPGMAAVGVNPLSPPGTTDADTPGPGPYAQQEPRSWAYDINPASGVARATFLGEVTFTSGGSGSAGVTSFNTRSGAVTLTAADVQAVGGAPLASPIFTGTPAAPTPAPGDSSTALATTAFVNQAIAADPDVSSFNGRIGAVTLTTGDVTGAGGAPAASPALTGTPTAPTGMAGDASSQIATDAFVQQAITGGTVTTFNGRKGAVSLSLSDVQTVGGAPIASPNFTGVPAVPTATPGTATTQAASTAFVTNAVTAGQAGVASFNARTGAVVLTTADVVAAGAAPILSPTFTGTPAAPTPTAGDASTKLATTAFVGTAIASLPAGVATFNGRAGTVTFTLADGTSVGLAPVASPTFTGTVIAPTPTPGDNSTKVATSAFVAAAIAPLATAASVPAASATVPKINAAAAVVGTDAGFSRGDHVHPTDTTRAAQTSLANYLPLGGGVMTGDISGAPNITGGNITANGGGLVSKTSGYCNLWSGGNPQFGFYDASGTILRGALFYITSTGAVVLRNASNDLTHDTVNTSITGNGLKPGGGPWAATSDIRIKTIRDEYKPGLDEVIQLRPVIYEYKGNDSATEGGLSLHRNAAEAHQPFVGLIAQEVETVFPGMVTKSAGYIDGKAVDDLRTLDTAPLIFALVNSIKELNARIAALEAA